ncbi:MAG: Hexuronate transporter [Bryobacteraceae bacterium]|nr:Hexuronate transporter [Bryobacteraceae bacterium]
MKSRRWLIAALLFLATVINYVDRQTLSVLAASISRELGLSNVEYSNVLTAFLVPYTFMYVLAGWLVDRWGSRFGLAVFMGWWSAANALHALARGAMSLGFFRFLLGLGESGNFLAAAKATSEWFPPGERALANGLVNAAASTGAILAPPLIAFVTHLVGWRGAFVVTGLSGFVWIAAWWMLNSTRPPFGEETGRGNVRYSALWRMKESWGLLLARVFADPVWWFYLFWLPKYLQEERHFSLTAIALFAWMPYLAADFGSVVGGWVSGLLIRRRMEELRARRWTMAPCALVMPVGILAAYLPTGEAMAVICLVTFCHMAWKTNLMTMTNDVYPTAAVGSASGVVGLGSGLGGVLSTPIVGRIVDGFGYTAVFWMMGFLHIVATALVYATVRRRMAGVE